MVHQHLLGVIHKVKGGIKMISKELKESIIKQQGDLLYTTLSEECSEVIQACSKIKRKQYYNEDFDIDNLLEEICDLEINLELIKEQLANEKSLNLTRKDIDKKIENWHNKKIEKISNIFLK
jgi:NTP pyrophosphatase (non-canonical NTP hydrolase)